MLILTMLEILKISSPEFTKNSKFTVSKIAKNDIFGPFEFTKIGFHIKLSGGKIIKVKP